MSRNVANYDCPSRSKPAILPSMPGLFPLTLSQFIFQLPASQHERAVSDILLHIGLVGKLVASDLRRAGLLDILGATGHTNVQGEAVKKLDEIANDTFLTVFAEANGVS